MLTDVEVRVLAALIEKEAAVPESYPLTLNALRLACNQTTNRRPVVDYDDRTVVDAVQSLKSRGLVRFVHPSHGGRTIRYRHCAGEHWQVSGGELLVLSALALRGAQPVAEVRARIGRLLPGDDAATVEELLDALASRQPDPLVACVGRRPGERDDRWIALVGPPPAIEDADDTGPLEAVEPAWLDEAPAVDVAALDERVRSLMATLADVTARLDRLERQIGD